MTDENYKINLNTASWEATRHLLALDQNFVGTEDYLGLAYFWKSCSLKWCLREATVAKRKKIHRLWLLENLPMTCETRRHWELVAQVLKIEIPKKIPEKCADHASISECFRHEQHQGLTDAETEHESELSFFLEILNNHHQNKVQRSVERMSRQSYLEEMQRFCKEYGFHNIYAEWITEARYNAEGSDQKEFDEKLNSWGVNLMYKNDDHSKFLRVIELCKKYAPQKKSHNMITENG